MGYTKRDFILGAYEEIGLASYDYDLTPGQLQQAKVKMDQMVQNWYARGIRINYPFSTTPDLSDIDEETEVPSVAWQPITLNLALRIAPGFGRPVMPELKADARFALNTLFAFVTTDIPQMRWPNTLPIGAGNKPWVYDNPFYQRNQGLPDGGADGPINYGAGQTTGQENT